MRKVTLSLCVMVVMAVAVPVSAGVIYEVENKVSFGGEGEVMTADIAIEGSQMKMDVTSGGQDFDGEVIYRGDSREMVVVNHGDKSYMVLDQEQMRAMAQQVNQAMASMEQALAGLPEAQRERMRQMMQSKMPDMGSAPEPSELRKTGASDTISGYPCTKYEVWRGGAKVREMWVTDWSNVEGGSEVSGVFESMAEFMTEMLESLPQMGGQAIGDPMYEHMKEMNGFPVRTLEYDDGRVVAEATLKGARKASLGGDAFQPPAGYKKMDMMKGMR